MQTELKAGYGMMELSVLAKALFAVGLILAITLVALSKFQATLTADTLEYNAIGKVITEVYNLTTWIGVIVIIIVGALLYGYSKSFTGGGGKR